MNSASAAYGGIWPRRFSQALGMLWYRLRDAL